MKRTSYIRRRSKTNSRRYENLALRRDYREQHQFCAGLIHRERRDGEHIHHVAHSSRRWDLWSNLIHLCFECHEFCHRFPHDGTLLCVRWKIVANEFDLEEWFTASGMRLEGYVAKCQPSHVAAVEAAGFLREWGER